MAMAAELNEVACLLIAAALGIACALADWAIVASGAAFTLAILFGRGSVEDRPMPK